jgi:hypothetical protein
LFPFFLLCVEGAGVEDATESTGTPFSVGSQTAETIPAPTVGQVPSLGTAISGWMCSYCTFLLHVLTALVFSYCARSYCTVIS